MRRSFNLAKNAMDKLAVLGHLGCLLEQGWIRGGVAWLVLSNAFEVAGVSYNDAELFELT